MNIIKIEKIIFLSIFNNNQMIYLKKPTKIKDEVQ
jgi:hypothetical protein